MTESEYYDCPICHEAEVECNVKAKQGGTMPPTYSYTCPSCGFHKYMLCYQDFCDRMGKMERTI